MPETRETEPWMQVQRIPTLTLRDFAQKHGLTLEVRERCINGVVTARDFSASFRNAEVAEDGMLRSSYGSGMTPDAAAEDYATKISLKRLAIGAYTPDRREINVPRLTHAPE